MEWEHNENGIRIPYGVEKKKTGMGADVSQSTARFQNKREHSTQQ